MAYIKGLSKNEYLLLPPSVDEWIPQSHSARIVELFVSGIEVKELGFVEENEQMGRPSYSPETMLKILLYGYANGERSSRKLERKTYEDLGYIWLTGNQHPDYRTIARFRQKNTEAIKALLKETLKLYSSVGYEFDGVIFSDGTKIYADASDENTINKTKLKEVEEKIEIMIKEAEKADKEEDASEGNKNGQFLSKEQINKLAEEVKKQKELLKASGKKSLSLTDKDANFMKHPMGHGKHLSYNAQASVDKNGVVLEADVNTDGFDSGSSLKERINSAEENTGKQINTVVADAGYYETNAVKEIMESGKKCIVSEQNSNDINECFKYDKKKNQYYCQEGAILNYIGKKKGRGKTYLVYAAAKDKCGNCKKNGVCYKGQLLGKYGRRIMIYEDRLFKEKYRKVLKDNIALVKKRKTTIEPMFGNVKERQRFRRFMLRGLEKVKSEWSLVTTTANLLKFWNIIEKKALVNG